MFARMVNSCRSLVHIIFICWKICWKFIFNFISVVMLQVHTSLMFLVHGVPPLYGGVTALTVSGKADLGK